MKLTSLHIEDFRQFKDFRLDFTDPATGMPLEKVCFIGPNGTGKSTLLAFIADCCGPDSPQIMDDDVPVAACCNLRTSDGNDFQLVHPRSGREPGKIPFDLVLYAPAEGESGAGSAEPETATLSNALLLQKSSDTKHLIRGSAVGSFWLRLVGHIKKREQEYLEFQRLPGNPQRTVFELDEEFGKTHPEVLNRLSPVWDRILSLAYLEFDRESVEVPVQLTDNFKAYIRSKTNGQRLKYASLSTGIRHYLFRLGQIWSIYFNRSPGDSFLLVDEPEGSLYPDFLYDIVENYREVAPGCQLFMATHSPIVASQFKPDRPSRHQPGG